MLWLHPITQSKANQTVFIFSAIHIIKVRHQCRSTNLQYCFFSCKPINLIRQFRNNTVPRRTVETVITPLARRNNTGQTTFFVLSLHNITQPFYKTFFHTEVKQHMLDRYSSIACPAVFFSVRTVCGKIIEIRKV